MRQARRDAGLEVGPTTEELAEIKRLRREVADQQRTIEILKAATSLSLRNSTLDIGECGVHRRRSSSLAGRGDVRRARSRGAHLLRSEATVTVGADTRRSGCQRRDSPGVGIELSGLWRETGVAHVAP